MYYYAVISCHLLGPADVRMFDLPQRLQPIAQNLGIPLRKRGLLYREDHDLMTIVWENDFFCVLLLKLVVTVNSSDCGTHSCDGHAMLFKLNDYGIGLTDWKRGLTNQPPPPAPPPG